MAVSRIGKTVAKKLAPKTKKKPPIKVKKPLIKVNSNPNKTPAKSMQRDVDAGKYSWRDNIFNSREGTGFYGEPTYNHNAPIKPFKIKSSIPKKRSK